MRSRASDSRLWIGRTRRGETSRRQFESARGYLLFRQDRDRVGHDRKAQRMAADALAIEVDHLVRRVDRYFAALERRDFLQREVLAPPQGGQVPAGGFEIDVPEDDDVQQSVRQVRGGRRIIERSEIPAVCDHKVVDDSFFGWPAVRFVDHVCVLVSRERSENCDDEGEPAAQDFGGAVHTIDDRSTRTEFGDVDEVAFLSSAGLEELTDARIDRLRLPLPNTPGESRRRGWNRERSYFYGSRPHREHRETRIRVPVGLPMPQVTVDDLIEGPVAADRDDRRGAVPQGCAGVVRSMAGTVGRPDREPGPELTAERAFIGLPATAHPTVRGGGVHNEDDVSRH